MSSGYFYCPYIPVIKNGNIVSTVDTTMYEIEIKKADDGYRVTLLYTNEIITYLLIPLSKNSGVIEMMDDIADCIHSYGIGKAVSLEMAESFWTSYGEFLYVESEDHKVFIRNAKSYEDQAVVLVAGGDVFATQPHNNHNLIEKYLRYFQSDIASEHEGYW